MDDKRDKWTELYDQAEKSATEVSLKSVMSRITERYVHLDLRGVGAMKKVICTEDKISGRLVAKATLKDPQNAENVEAFFREARITAQLQHPNIVPVYDMGLDENDEPFFIMKLIKGQTLEVVLSEIEMLKDDSVSSYPLGKRLEIFGKVCDAISYAHAEGILHLDLKPANIQVSAYGDVIVCDWGLASFVKQIDEPSEPQDDHYEYCNNRYFTLCGQIKGTPGYMAPEQAMGTQEAKDQRTDIFSLGCILYELLTMQAAIPGAELEEVLANTIQGSITQISQVKSDLSIPTSLVAVCMKALEREPAKRYQSVVDLKKDIDAYRQGFATEAENSSLLTQLHLLYKRNRLTCHLAAFLLLAIFVISSFAIVSLKAKEKATAHALEKLRTEKAFNEKIAGNASVVYIDDGEEAYFRFDNDEALEQLEMGLRLKPNTQKALVYMGKIWFTQQNFTEAYKYLKDFPEHQDLAEFCLEVKELKLPLTLQKMYPMVQKIIKENRYILRSQLYKNALFQGDDFQRMRKDCLWLLQQENKGSIAEFQVEMKEGFLRISMSGSVDLRTLESIKMFPIDELDLRAAKIKEWDFLQTYPKLDTLYLRKGQLSWQEKALLKSIKIIED